MPKVQEKGNKKEKKEKKQSKPQSKVAAIKSDINNKREQLDQNIEQLQQLGLISGADVAKKDVKMTKREKKKAGLKAKRAKTIPKL